MPIRYRLLLLLPLLVTLGIGSFGLFSIRLIRHNLGEAESQHVVQADQAAAARLTEWRNASLDAVQNVALNFNDPGPLGVVPDWPRGLDESTLDFAFVFAADGAVLNAWVRGHEQVPPVYLRGWENALQDVFSEGRDWEVRNLAGEAVAAFYEPISSWEIGVDEEGAELRTPIEGAAARGAVILGWRFSGAYLDSLKGHVDAEVVLVSAATGLPVHEARAGTHEVFLGDEVADWLREVVIGPNAAESVIEVGDRVLLGRPLRRNGEVAGAWVILSDIGSMRESLQSLIDVLTVSLVLWLVIAAISAVLVGSSIANPIERLASAVGDLQKDESVDLPMDRRDELGILARSVVEMHAEIQEQIGSLEGMHTQTQAALETRSRFLSSMSHELRTPLNAIIGMAEVLREPYWGELSPDQEGFVDNIVDSARHLLTLINDILDVSRAEAGKIGAMPEMVEAAPLLRAVVGEQGILAERAEVAVSTECEDGASIWCDPRHARQILTNLLSNAIKYNRAGGEVAIRAIRDLEGGHTLLEVADTGIGIPEEEQERVFEAFARPREAETSTQPGTGLGLALVRQLVELNDGHVVLHSSTDDGTTIHLVFNAAPPPEGKSG